ncbi:ADP-ribosylation/Crystallin J1 [Fusarium redolens]|uniref:ADP-ribosylhydrolase ARH3 n=1 Tax=Fusarium redolens TaxID=48865 RepID=A0A9P9JXG6_FUSRE|nr:ADP-ribosylation/Crystallin J1 [Fusarium redolens]KAH7236831.1 ADP-ribosylation/Crystallin J1 [Fusarium redolens]
MSSPRNESGLSPRESRVIGALLGVHAGDSLGATLEFKTHTDIAREYPLGLREIVGGGPFRWSQGHATDDTDMTRGVLLAYHDYKAGDDVARLAGDYFINWLRGDWPGRRPGSRPEDIGGATFDGLTKYKRTRDPDRAGAGEGSAGNGSLMRCIPTGLFQPDPQKLVEESVRISKITHDDKRCTVACAAYNMIVSKLIDQIAPPEAIEAGLKVAESLEGASGPVYEAIELGKSLNVATMAEKGPAPELGGRCSGYVLESLSLAIAAVLDTRGLEDIVVDVVRIGWDTDTNGAIAGGILGARDGTTAIPPQWRSVLQFGREFEKTALSILKGNAA